MIEAACACIAAYGERRRLCPDYNSAKCRTVDEAATKFTNAALAADPSRGVLNERGSTHGDFTENGKIMQALKVLMREHWGWQKLDTAQREALEMIQHKIGRILCGDNNYFDHWRDIAGYAKLIEERCPKPEETTK